MRIEDIQREGENTKYVCLIGRGGYGEVHKVVAISCGG